MALFMYVQSVLAAPSDPERRLVSLLSPTFTACVGTSPRGLEAMMAIGFTATHQSHDGTPFLFMPVASRPQLAQIDAELRARLRLPDGDVPERFVQSAMASSRLGNPPALRAILAAMRHEPGAAKAMRTLLRYVRAVKRAPWETQHRLVSLSSREFLESVGAVPRGMEAMRALGFVGALDAPDGSGSYAAMPVVDGSLLPLLEEALEQALSRALAHEAAQRRPLAASQPPGPKAHGQAAPQLRRRAARARANVRWQGEGEAAGGGEGASEEEEDALFADGDGELQDDEDEDEDEAAELGQGGSGSGGMLGGGGGGAAGDGGLGTLPPAEVLLRALLACVLDGVMRLGMLRPPPGVVPRFGGAPGVGNASAAPFFGSAGVNATAGGGGVHRRGLPGIPVPGLPPSFRLVFGRSVPPGAVPVASIDLASLPALFGLGGLGGLDGGPAGANASAGGLGPNGAAAEEPESELSALETRLRRAPLSAEAREVAARELRRLKRMPPMHSDYSTTFDYLECLAEMPWGGSAAEGDGGGKSEERAPSISLSKARAALERDHCGLPKVKRRVVEYLATTKLTRQSRGTILCLLGPPGVGKTSLGQSVAASLGRKYQRISLGGVHSESEVRGHRRTYVGALPGLLMQAMRKAGTPDPVIVLDEIDKLGTRSLHGDPSSALLEVLDPEQNGAFRDHFLNVPFNLSRVLFIATANEADGIARPLLDRLELVELSGYTTDDKVRIARTHLLPKQLERHGLREGEVVVSDRLLEVLASRYTREAGVRELDRTLAAVCRAVAADVAEEMGDDNDDDDDDDRESKHQAAVPGGAQAKEAGSGGGNEAARAGARAEAGAGSGEGAQEDGAAKQPRDKTRVAPRAPRRLKPLAEAGVAEPAATATAAGEDDSVAAANASAAGETTPARAAARRERPARASVVLTMERVREILGPEKYEAEAAERLSVCGVAMGMAYTAVGGDLLFIEASKMAGTGKVVLTGRIGEVMKESATTALSWLRAHAKELGLAQSASIDVLNGTDVHLHFPAGATPKDGPSAGVTIVSALVSLLTGRLCRSDTAMTGEVTLRGLVLPVGGIREKVISAHRAGLRRIILPEKNRKDLAELPTNVAADIEFVFASNVQTVLENALHAPDHDRGGSGAGEPRVGDESEQAPLPPGPDAPSPFEPPAIAPPPERDVGVPFVG